MDDRPVAVAQRGLAAMLNNSPRVLQQRALGDAVHNSQRMVTQRHEMNALFGGAVQPQGDGAMSAELSPAQREQKPNNTGLPNQLKSGIESLSGMSMDHVEVHYNSDKPAQLQAHAYAQGSEIHLGPGQERHLPHEAWHVVQQAQGRVRPTLQMKAGAVNDDPLLEKEADMMGGKAARFDGEHDARKLVAEERQAGVGIPRVAGFVAQAVLNINGLPHAAQVTEQDAPDGDVRARLNAWRVSNHEYAFTSMEEAYQKTQHYLDRMNAADDLLEALSGDYIDNHWRDIEALIAELEVLCGDESLLPAQNIIDPKKWEIVDAIRNQHADNEDREISDNAGNHVFEGKRTAIIQAGLDHPQIPQVNPENLAAQVADSMNSDDKVGHLNWVNDDANNTFRQWVRSEAVQLTDNSSMNCWEAIFYSAYHAGLMTRDQILELYAELDRVGDYLVARIDESLAPKMPLFEVIESGGLQRGDIILTTGWVGDHVAMSLGGNDVLSLWSRPNENLTLQRTTLPEIADDLSAVRVVRNSTLFVQQ